MAGKPRPRNEIIARQKRVEEYLASGLRATTIAKIMGFPERTIHNDATLILNKWAENDLKNSQEKREANLSAWNQRWHREREKAEVMRASAEARDDRLIVLRINAHIRELEKQFADVNGKGGRFTVVAEKVDLTQRVVVNPLDGLVDDERDDERETKSESDSSSKD